MRPQLFRGTKVDTSVYLSACVCVCVSARPSVHLSMRRQCFPVRSSVCLFEYVFVHLSIFNSPCPFAFASPSVHLPASVFGSPSIHLPVNLPACLRSCLPACFHSSASVFAGPPVSVSAFVLAPRLSAYLSPLPSVRPAI